MRRAFITGMGCVGPHGIGLPAYEECLRRGRSAVRALSLFPAEGLASRVAGEVPGFEPDTGTRGGPQRHRARVVPMALLAAREALAHAGFVSEDLHPDVRRDFHVLVGSGAGCVEYAERRYATFFRTGSRSVGAYAVPASTTGMLSSELSIELGFSGRSHVLSNGCTSSTDAIGYALDLVRAGRAETILTGGADACITPGVLAGYCNMQVVSRAWNETPERASRPMSVDRDGFVLAEGAWLLVVESEDSMLRRGGRPLAEIMGYGASCEAYHRVAMREDGIEPARAMDLALQDAGLGPDTLDYVNLHGTSTRLNDRVETRALKRLLSGRAPRVPMSATKSLIGHPQGAAGAAGVVATVVGMQGGFIHPTANLDTPDPECDLDYVPNESRSWDVGFALCSCLGFGSKNAALVLRNPSA